MYLGAFDMLSMPLATTTSLKPNWILCAARITAIEQRKCTNKFFKLDFNFTKINVYDRTLKYLLFLMHKLY